MAVAQKKPGVWKDPVRKRQNIHSFNDMRRYREWVWRGIDDLVAGLNERKLHSVVRIPWFKARYTLEDVIFQASFEQAHHLGEIIGAYWQMDKAPPQMMFIPTMLGLRASVR